MQELPLSRREDDLSPTGYRGLAILSKLYRLWATIRLEHVQEWVGSWATKDLFAGTCEPVGAEDGWYLMALLLEEARVQGIPLTGGSADLWKCFDQIQIAFLCQLLRLAGYPTGPLTAYSNFHQPCL